jgi:hypothetical protein
VDTHPFLRFAPSLRKRSSGDRCLAKIYFSLLLQLDGSEDEQQLEGFRNLEILRENVSFTKQLSVWTARVPF